MSKQPWELGLQKGSYGVETRRVAASIHPKRKRTLEVVGRAFAKGARSIKEASEASGYSREAVRKVLKEIKKLGLPVDHVRHHREVAKERIQERIREAIRAGIKSAKIQQKFNVRWFQVYQEFQHLVKAGEQVTCACGREYLHLGRCAAQTTAMLLEKIRKLEKENEELKKI